MSQLLSRVRFQQLSGRLKGVEVRRASAQPIVSALHRALFAFGVVVTAYHVQATPEGLEERLELSSIAGGELDDAQSEKARAAILPLALDAHDASR